MQSINQLDRVQISSLCECQGMSKLIRSSAGHNGYAFAERQNFLTVCGDIFIGMETHFLTRHRRKLYFALAFFIIAHALNIFVFDKYLSQFAFSSFWLLIFPGVISLYLIFAIAFEFTSRKDRKPIVRTVVYIFWGLLTGALTFFFLFSLWYFGGLKYVFIK